MSRLVCHLRRNVTMRTLSAIISVHGIHIKCNNFKIRFFSQFKNIFPVAYNYVLR